MGRALYIYDVLAEAGVPVIRYPGWEYAGSPTLDEAWQVFHHTASSVASGNHGALGTVANGRPDLSPPLANTEVGRNGEWVVVASGRANHAGDSEYPDGVADDNGHSLGHEVENNGVDEPWSSTLRDSLARGMAALAVYKGWARTGRWIGNVVGHKEICRPVGRKIDPANIDLDEFRQQVGSYMADPDPTPDNSEDSDMVIVPPKGRGLGPAIVVAGTGAHYVGTPGAFRQASGMTVVELPNTDAGVAEYKRWQGRVGLLDRLLRRRRIPVQVSE